jgi:hypothetical protein
MDQISLPQYLVHYKATGKDSLNISPMTNESIPIIFITLQYLSPFTTPNTESFYAEGVR